MWNRRNDWPIPLHGTKKLLALNAILSTKFNWQTKNWRRTSTKQIQITNWTVPKETNGTGNINYLHRKFYVKCLHLDREFKSLDSLLICQTLGNIHVKYLNLHKISKSQNLSTLSFPLFSERYYIIRAPEIHFQLSLLFKFLLSLAARSFLYMCLWTTGMIKKSVDRTEPMILDAY